MRHAVTTLFPLTVATGKAFCNRAAERRQLIANIRSHTHTLISAPRRYGKTSLVAQVIGEISNRKFASADVDFFMCGTDASARGAILRAVGRLIGEIMPLHQKAAARVASYLSSLTTKIVMDGDGMTVELAHSKKPEQDIETALKALDKIAGAFDYDVVLFFDEFQQLGQITDNTTIEASIRSAAQYAKHAAYIFSGSSRHLLDAMFNSNNRPLYHMCDRISLVRIAAADYRKFIQAAAAARWGRKLDGNVIDSIFLHSALHPYNLNVLCRKLWLRGNPPDLRAIMEFWAEHVAEERDRVMDGLRGLSNNQRELLAALTLNPTSQPQGSEFLEDANIKPGSVRQSLDKLRELDLIFKDADDVFRVTDPVVRDTIRIQAGQSILEE